MLRLTHSTLLETACLHPTPDEYGGGNAGTATSKDPVGDAAFAPADPIRDSFPISKRPIGSPRVLNVFSNHWDGPRPGIVVMAFHPACVNLRVFCDLANDRGLGCGSEINPTSVTVYEPLTEEQRNALCTRHKGHSAYWAEWPTPETAAAAQGGSGRLDAIGREVDTIGDRINGHGADLVDIKDRLAALQKAIDSVALGAVNSKPAVANREPNVDGDEAPTA